MDCTWRTVQCDFRQGRRIATTLSDQCFFPSFFYRGGAIIQGYRDIISRSINISSNFARFAALLQVFLKIEVFPETVWQLLESYMYLKLHVKKTYGSYIFQTLTDIIIFIPRSFWENHSQSIDIVNLTMKYVLQTLQNISIGVTIHQRLANCTGQQSGTLKNVYNGNYTIVVCSVDQRKN